MSPSVVALFVITLGAAIVNGALGYGFSSITVPLALLFLTNRVLNPALVLIEVALNAWVLWVNRAAVNAPALQGVEQRLFDLGNATVATAFRDETSPGLECAPDTGHDHLGPFHPMQSRIAKDRIKLVGEGKLVAVDDARIDAQGLRSLHLGGARIHPDKFAAHVLKFPGQHAVPAT